MNALPVEILRRIVDCVVIPHQKDLRAFSERVNTLTRINRAFHDVVVTHPVASRYAYVHLGTCLFDAEACIETRKTALRDVVARGSGHDIPRFLECLRGVPHLTRLGLWHVPLLDMSMDAQFRQCMWPETLEHVVISTGPRGRFVLPNAFPPRLRSLVFEGGEGEWLHPPLPPTLTQLEFRQTGISMTPNIFSTLPKSLDTLVLDVHMSRTWFLMLLACRCPDLRVLKIGFHAGPVPDWSEVSSKMHRLAVCEFLPRSADEAERKLKRPRLMTPPSYEEVPPLPTVVEAASPQWSVAGY